MSIRGGRASGSIASFGVDVREPKGNVGGRTENDHQGGPRPRQGTRRPDGGPRPVGVATYGSTRFERGEGFAFEDRGGRAIPRQVHPGSGKTGVMEAMHPGVGGTAPGVDVKGETCRTGSTTRSTLGEMSFKDGRQLSGSKPPPFAKHQPPSSSEPNLRARRSRAGPIDYQGRHSSANLNRGRDGFPRATGLGQTTGEPRSSSALSPPRRVQRLRHRLRSLTGGRGPPSPLATTTKTLVLPPRTLREQVAKAGSGPEAGAGPAPSGRKPAPGRPRGFGQDLASAPVV